MSLHPIVSSPGSPSGSLPAPITPLRQPSTWARSRVTVRPIEAGDAESLSRVVTTDSVTRFIPPPPATSDRFRAFIAWAQAEQAAGRQRCFAIVPQATGTAAGLIQVRYRETEPDVVELGFVLAQPLWGTGLFVESAAALLDSLFGKWDIRRVEAHTALVNERGMGVLRKLGFVQQPNDAGVLKASTGTFSQALWTITPAQWRIARRRFLES